MIRRRATAVLSLLVLALSACAALAQLPAARPATPGAAAPAPRPPVATVGSRSIPRVELDQRVDQVLADYNRRKGGAMPGEMRDLVRRQVLEGLIRAELMTLEAKRLGMVASEAEGEEALKQMPVFNAGGKFDATRYQGIKTMQPREFTAALTSVREQLAARKLAVATEQRLSPSDAELRASASRALARVTVDVLPLRAADFGAPGEEPRESQVVGWYRSHLRDYERPARATLTIVFVNSPTLGDSLKHNASAHAQWNARMRAEAERIITQVQQGFPLDSAALDLGPRGNIAVASDNFPGYWRGTPSQSARIFEPAEKGHVLPEPIQANDGWLVVRVDDETPAHLAPLREVAREIRAQLRRDNRLHRDENERRALYARLADSLAAPGWPIRYAAVNAATVPVPEPGQQDLDTYYRAHQADYATFDARSGGIVSRSLDEVRGEVRARYIRDRRQLQARATAERLLNDWTSSSRPSPLDAGLGTKVTPPLVAHSVIDTGLVARALGDTIWSFADLQKGGMLPYANGFIVWQALTRVPRVVPTAEQVATMLENRVQQRHVADDEAGGRALFETNPRRYARGKTIHFTEVAFAPRSPLTISLSRDEVEKWYHSHIEKYSAPEMVTARHILITPTDKSPAADEKALAKAKEILRRIQGGEDFAALARAYSEDPATRDIGGDLGAFARGTMLEPVEDVAFKLPAGTLYDQPVKTVLGYHILKVTDHVPLEVKKLSLIYAAVGSDAAIAKANRIAQFEGDSLLRVVRSARDFAAAGRRAGAEVAEQQIGDDEKTPNDESQALFSGIQSTPAGHIVPVAYPVNGRGTICAVVDSITPAATPTWEQARRLAISEYQRAAGTRALDAKRAELDSLLASGEPLDSLAAPWGGLQHVADLTPGRALPSTGSSTETDSLLFGDGRSGPALAVGKESGWVTTPGGLVRIRCLSRDTPNASRLSENAEQLRKGAVEQKLQGFFDELKRRYPVTILDRQLREVSLLAPQQAVPAR